jgi:hypothetical protein
MMDIQSTREKLRKLKSKKLFETAMSQRKSRCILDGYCSLHFRYEGYTFCLSEVLGKGCEVQELEKLDKEICQSDERFDASLSLFAFNEHQKCLPETFPPDK